MPPCCWLHSISDLCSRNQSWSPWGRGFGLEAGLLCPWPQWSSPWSWRSVPWRLYVIWNSRYVLINFCTVFNTSIMTGSLYQRCQVMWYGIYLLIHCRIFPSVQPKHWQMASEPSPRPQMSCLWPWLSWPWLHFSSKPGTANHRLITVGSERVEAIVIHVHC